MGKKIQFETDQVIYEIGDASNGAYIILSGHVDLFSKTGVRLTTLGEGEIFSESVRLLIF